MIKGVRKGKGAVTQQKSRLTDAIKGNSVSEFTNVCLSICRFNFYERTGPTNMKPGTIDHYPKMSVMRCW